MNRWARIHTVSYIVPVQFLFKWSTQYIPRSIWYTFVFGHLPISVTVLSNFHLPLSPWQLHKVSKIITESFFLINNSCHDWINKDEFTPWVILYQCNFSSSDQLDISLVQYDTHLFLVIVVLGLKFSLLLTRLPNFSAIFTLWWDPRASKKTCALIGYPRVQNVFSLDSLVDSQKRK